MLLVILAILWKGRMAPPIEAENEKLQQALSYVDWPVDTVVEASLFGMLILVAAVDRAA